MVKQLTSYAAIVLFLTLLGVSSRAGLQQSRERLDQIERDLWADVPHLVCIDDNIATAAQPGEGAYIKLAAVGFRTVLSLRTSSEGIDQAKERTLVERAGLIYVNIPVASSDPKPEQAAAFLAAVRNRANYPMLIHCGSGSRVGGFWMIYRVLEQGWPEDKALEEATRIGLSSPVIKKFAMDYISSHRP